LRHPYISNYTQGGTISVIDPAQKKALPPLDLHSARL
jgi:hypothetical protein